MNLRRLFVLIASLFVILSPAVAVVNQPESPFGQFFQNPSLIGCTNFQVDLSTNPSSITTGSGFLYRLCAFNANGSTTAGYAVGYDSASASGLGTFGFTAVNNGGFTNAAVPIAHAITGPIQSEPIGGTYAGTMNQGCADIENAPARFNNGLVVALSSNTMQAVGCYRLDTGTNP